jgi:hypothetical protein
MTPNQFAERYHRMRVFLGDHQASSTTYLDPGSWVETKVASYRLRSSGFEDAFMSDVKIFADGKDNRTRKKTDESITVVIETTFKEIDVRNFTDFKEFRYSARAPFSGKGSPEEVQLMLQLQYRFRTGLKFGMQEFTKMAFIGLDCNGFVGNYIYRVRDWREWLRHYPPPDPGPSSTIPRLMDETTYIRSQQEMIDDPGAVYIMGMCDERGVVRNRFPRPDGTQGEGHITITEPNTIFKAGDVVLVTVVESTGDDGKAGHLGGLVTSVYHVPAPDKHGVFHVKRGSKGLGTMKVRIGKLKPKGG